jgi:hypothetical protein
MKIANEKKRKKKKKMWFSNVNVKVDHKHTHVLSKYLMTNVKGFTFFHARGGERYFPFSFPVPMYSSESVSCENGFVALGSYCRKFIV